MEYELLFFASLTNEDKIDQIKKDLVEILESLGAKLQGDFTDIGKRKLAYPIKRDTHAFFSFVHFMLEDENRQNIPEIAKRINLYNHVIRHIIVRADEIGKTLGAVEIKPQETPREKPARKEAKAKPEAKAPEIETKPKAALSDLDEKLTEILEENPE